MGAPAAVPQAEPADAARADLLEARGLTVRFGGVRAVDGVDVELRKGEILGLIGPNGAGKTTLFNLIAGVVPPSRGVIRYRGRAITRLNAARSSSPLRGSTFLSGCR